MDPAVEKAVAEYLANLKQEGQSDETVLWRVKELTYLKHFLVELQCELVRDLTINHRAVPTAYNSAPHAVKVWDCPTAWGHPLYF